MRERRLNRTAGIGRAGLCVLFAATFAVSSCRKIAGLTAQKGREATGTSGKDEASIEAMNDYAKGFNVLIDRPQGLLKTYFSAVPESGPEDGKKYQFSADHVFAEPKIAEAKRAFAAAAKAAPAALRHLEPLATACTADIEKIAETFKAAHGYYQTEGFKNDKGEQGKKLHGELAKLADTFRTDVEKLESALSEIESRQADEELKQFSNRTTYGYWFRFFNRQASRVMSAKPENFATAFTALEGARGGLSDFTKGKSPVQPVFKSYVDAAERFFSDSERLKREFENKGPAPSVDTVRDSLTSNYNALVGISNSLRDLEVNGLLK